MEDSLTPHDLTVKGIRSITWWRIGGIGDMVLSVPCLRAIRRACPEAHIQLYGHVEAAKLLVDAGLADSAHRQGKNSREYENFLEIIGYLGAAYTDEYKKQINRSLGNPDLMICFSTDAPRASFALQMMGVSRFVVENWIPPMGVHQSEFMALALRNAGIPCNWRLQDEVDPINPGYNYGVLEDNAVIVHPGAGHKYKRWPLANYIELVDQLEDMGKMVYAIEGPEEKGSYNGKFRNTLRDISLTEAAGLLQTKVPFIGNDSGITHLASILGCPTVAIFGPTSPAEFGPIGNKTRIIHNCPKEGLGTVQKCYKPDCLQSITIKEVVDAFERITGK